MSWTIDARIPVRFGCLADAGDGDALLLEGGGTAPAGVPAAHFALAEGAHAPGCACCVARSPAALALHTLFQARARGEVAFFRRVLAVTASEAAGAEVRAAVAGDQLAAARFRLEAGG